MLSTVFLLTTAATLTWAFFDADSIFGGALEKRQNCAIDCATMGSTCSPCSKRTVADFVLIIDCSSSMQDNIDAVNSGMQAFVAAIDKRDIDAYFMVILNGVKPEILVDWTQDGDLVQHVLSGVNAGGPCDGCKKPDVTHFNHDCTGCSTREAPFEPILMTLGVAGPNGGGRQLIDRHPKNTKYAPGTGPVQFHPDSRKFFIVLTDEDADCPHYEANRFKTPSGDIPKCVEPPKTFPQRKSGIASDIWIDEIDYTVSKVIAADASVHIFCDRSRAPSANQFGDPNLQQQNGDFTNFNEEATLTKLLANANTKYSFQAKAIQAKTPTNVATYRVFDVDLVTRNNGKNVENFFNQVVEAVDAGCFLRRKRQTVNQVPCNRYECHCSGCKTIPLCNPGCEQCTIDGKCYAPYDKNPANGCQQCLPSKSKTSWSSCDDANQCTTDVCENGQCVYKPICTKECNLCTIGGACVPFKSFKPNDPAGSDCHWCNPACNDQEWTPTGFCPGLNPPVACGGAPPTPPPVVATCEDTVQNQGEQGVDCGGPCKACDPCANNIKDANEFGVDCGPFCPVKTCMTDNNEGTCADGIRQPTETCTDCGGRCPNPCSDAQLAACNGVPMLPNDGVPSGTCTDGLQNLGEAGPDCGGRCPTPCVPPPTGYPGTCADGIQNFGETGIDCGGRCFLLGGRKCSFDAATPGTTASCTDQVQNQGEAGVDCGGPCPNGCPGDTSGTCTDSLRNGNELGVDCGGRCPTTCTAEMLVQTCTEPQLKMCADFCLPNLLDLCQCTPTTQMPRCALAVDQRPGAGSVRQLAIVLAALCTLMLLY